MYGLAASACDRDAVGAIFEAKERPRDNPLIVHFSDTDEALDVVPRNLGLTRALVGTFAPGPLTVIVPAPPWAVPEVRGGLPTIAVRVPDLELARRVIAAAGVPVAAPSANRTGRPSPTTAVMAMDEMGGRVAAILDGGPCTVGIESTIVDATSDREAVILRPGDITAREIADRLGCAVRFGGTGDAPSPGTRYRHYTPCVPVVLVRTEDIAQAREEAQDQGNPTAAGALAVLSVERFGGVKAYAEHLYGAFRDAERRQCLLILAEIPPAGSDSEGLTDRLTRAAAGRYRPGLVRDAVFSRSVEWDRNAP